jgi:quercetin dioxygenase-like cupin family protein
VHSPDQDTPVPPMPRTLCPPVTDQDGPPGWECSWWSLPPGSHVARPQSPVRAWLVALAGRSVLRIGEDSLLVRPGDTFVIPAGSAYRLTACGREPAQLLDVTQTPAAPEPGPRA